MSNESAEFDGGAEAESRPETERTTALEATKTYGEHQRHKALSERRYRGRRLIRRAIEAGNRALVHGKWLRLWRICTDRLQPALSLSVWTAPDYHDALVDSHLAWDWEALNRFLEDPDAYADPFYTRQSEVVAQKARTEGKVPPRDIARRTITRAFKSMESIGVAKGAIPARLTQQSAVTGYELQLGVKWQQWDYETPDEVRIVNPELHPPFSLSLGKPGNGKSTSVETLVEDAYAAGYKIIDLLDFDELENAMYDVPSADTMLQNVRKELGLPPTWDEHLDYERPDVEILHPLCESFCNSPLPYDLEEEEFVARPFVIPVADLDYTTIKAMLPNLTTDQEKHLSKALDEMSGDWSLGELAEAVMYMDIRSDVKGSIISAIKNLNNRGFIATRDHEYAIDWDRIFRDTDTITCFTVSMLDQREYKLMAATYLCGAIYETRQPDGPEMDDDGNVITQDQYPRAFAVMREIQDAAPGDSKINGSDAVAQLRTELVDRMQTIGEKRRHTDLGIFGDTQQWLQANARVRENADRLLLFKLNAGTAMGLFKQLTGSKQTDYAQKVGSFDRGECSVVGSEWLSTGQPFAQPISWAPPMCHHLDSETEGEGWNVRVEHLDTEELRQSPYTLSGRKESDPYSFKAVSPDDPEAAENAPAGFDRFIAVCLDLTNDDRDRVAKADVQLAYEAFAQQQDIDLPPNDVYFGRWISAYIGDRTTSKKLLSRQIIGSRFEPDDEDTLPSEIEQKAWTHIQLTDDGQRYLDEALAERDAAGDTDTSAETEDQGDDTAEGNES